MRFVVRLHSFACTLPSSSSPSPARPCLRLNFDGYKKLSTKPLPSALTAASAALVFPEAYTFQYETAYPQKLHQKQLTVTLYSHNTILADTLLGRAAITLHTIATGPIAHDLPLLNDGKESGRVRLTVEMEQLVSMSLHLQSVSLSSLPTIHGKAPVSHLSYGYTGLDSKRFKTDKQSNTVSPEWSGAAQLQPVKFHIATVKELWREGLEIEVMIKRRRGDKSHKCGSVLVRLASHHSFVEKGGLSVVERLQPTPDYSQLQCLVRLHFHYEGVASYVQMSKGRHDEKGVHDGQPFAEGLPLPSTHFYKTNMQPPPASTSTTAIAPAPAAAARASPAGGPVRRGGGQAGGKVGRGERERSVMSIRAAREYDGASIVRGSYNYADEDDEDGHSPPPRTRHPPRAASVMGIADATASASSQHSKGLSRSSSSGSLASSAAPSRPRTPNSQKRYLAYPPPPPPKPEQLAHHLRALSIADQPPPAAFGGPPGGAVGGRAVSFDSQPRELTPTSQRSRDGLSSPGPSSAMSPMPGVTGFCAMCGRPSNQFCNETLQPVCSHPCTVKALSAAGLPLPFVDEEKQRPPPLNPSAYPLLSPSVSHRQPGPAGFCVICQHPALYLCKDTLVPVCSAECKLVHLKLNPHLKGGRGGAGPEASAPAVSARAAAAYSVSDGGQPACVVCGRRAEFRCSVSNDRVCGMECKQTNLARTARRPRVSPSASPTPPSPVAAAAISCPACTYANAPSAAVCDMCGGVLPCSAGSGSGSGGVSPRAPVYHLFQSAPGLPKRPSFAAVGSGDLRAGPGGPASR